MSAVSGGLGSRTGGAAQERDGQSDDAPHKFEGAAHRDSDDAEGEEEPDNGIKDQCRDGERPAQDEEDAPE